MLKLFKHGQMGKAHHGWLKTIHHFSFADYYDPKRIQFGVLRVVNDDVIAPGTGFGMHPHRDMEIVSYVLDGALTHKDSMGNESTLGRGEVQYMSAGTGVVHSEYNNGSEPARLFQIWVMPNKRGTDPDYGEYRFKWEDRQDKWMKIISGSPEEGFPIQFHADLKMYATAMSPGTEQQFEIAPGRQAYVAMMEGSALINGLEVGSQDALEAVEESLSIKAPEGAHLLVFEMAKP